MPHPARFGRWRCRTQPDSGGGGQRDPLSIEAAQLQFGGHREGHDVAQEGIPAGLDELHDGIQRASGIACVDGQLDGDALSIEAAQLQFGRHRR
jgi:hypothetical protein